MCDAVEFHSDPNGVELFGRTGKWSIMPVEYKRGESKPDESDIMQVIAQGLCLEEMFGCKVTKCAIFYGKNHSRDYVLMDENIKGRFLESLRDMHKYFDRHITPKAYKSKKCLCCSLADICVPSIFEEQSVSGYIQSHIKDDK